MKLHFKDRASWRSWLEENHAAVDTLWVVFFKKHTGRENLSYDAAVEEALCFGWIDSLVKRLDDDRYARKFTPRKKASKWSASNLTRVRRLIAEGRMTDAGLAVYDPNVAAHQAPAVGSDEVPAFLTDALDTNPAAKEFFAGLAPSYRRAYIGWISSAKRKETRDRRLAEAISLLSQGKKLGMK
jgi:uncharacterized protein YdeI (YjbR/CyaY-like superfamily)